MGSHWKGGAVEKGGVEGRALRGEAEIVDGEDVDVVDAVSMEVSSKGVRVSSWLVDFVLGLRLRSNGEG